MGTSQLHILYEEWRVIIGSSYGVLISHLIFFVFNVECSSAVRETTTLSTPESLFLIDSPRNASVFRLRERAYSLIIPFDSEKGIYSLYDTCTIGMMLCIINYLIF